MACRPSRFRRSALTLALTGAALLGATAVPAGDPAVPEEYISVAEVKALLDPKQRVVFVDVRHPAEFAELHILGALNIPLRELPRRLREVPRQDFVVLY